MARQVQPRRQPEGVGLTDMAKYLVSKNDDPKLGFLIGEAVPAGRDGPGRHVANVYDEEDARLFAAAPDLLAALIDAAYLLDVYSNPALRAYAEKAGQARATIREATAAIAKARS